MQPSTLKIVFALFFTLLIFKLHGQENLSNSSPPLLKKNTIYATVYFVPAGFLWAGLYNVNAERSLWNTNSFVKNIRARLGVGGVSGTNDVISFTGTINALTGSRAAHFEMNLGAAWFYDKFDHENYITPAGALGFRLQKPDGHFVLRVGAGFPEFLYLSLGFAF